MFLQLLYYFVGREKRVMEAETVEGGVHKRVKTQCLIKRNREKKMMRADKVRLQ